MSELADAAERQFLWERQLRESQTAGPLLHPNIVAVYDMFEQGAWPTWRWSSSTGPHSKRCWHATRCQAR